MLPSIADVVAMPEFRQGRPRVVAGASGLDRRVRWVHSAEVSDIARLLRGGDLVLTTGIALPDENAGLSSYVADLVSAQAAGLVVELGRRWTDALPDAMVNACEQAGLPLIAWQREVRFARVAQAVGELVVDAQLTELRAAEQIHRTFTELSIAGTEPAEILAEIRRISGLPVVLESTRHHILGFDASDDVTELLADWDERSRAVAPAERTAYDEAAGWLVTVVGARGDDWGRLILVCPESPPDRLIVLAERGASALALQRLAARDRESLERQTHRTLLTALAAGTTPTPELLARCSAAGVPMTGRRLVGLVAMPAGDAFLHAPVLATQERLRDLAEITAGTARHAGTAALVGVVDDEAVLALLSLPARIDHAVAVDHLSDLLHRAAASAPRPMPVLVAAGTGVDLASAAQRTLNEARHVASAALRTSSSHQQVSCHRLENVRLRGLIQLLRDDDRLDAFAERELAPLLAYDERHGTTLTGILRAYVEHGGRKSAAAAAVHLSRPAFYERLARIEHILGVDLDDPESITSLHVAVLTHTTRT